MELLHLKRKKMNRPQTIQIFLTTGDPAGIKLVEITNRMIQGVFFPRKEITSVGDREEIRKVGIYFLFGQDESKSKTSVYIGEAEDCFKRIQQHRSKEFWKHAVAFISQKSSFTKGHVRFLEHVAIEEAKKANRFDISENGNSPKKPHVTESMEAELFDAFDTIKVLLSTLGYPVFDTIKKDENELFYVNGKGVKASGNLLNDGFVIYKGSEAVISNVESIHPFLTNLKERLSKDGILKIESDKYVFQENYVFGSPSTAGGIVLGRNTNGWNKWKDKDGRTLDELKRK